MRTLIGLLGLALLGCSMPLAVSPAEKVVREYLSVKDRAAALSCLAEDYRLWFNEKKGSGMSKAQVAEMLQWDFALHPSHRIDEIRLEGDRVVVRAHEENDFSRLIGFPGWDATTNYWVNNEGKIRAQLYVPRAGQPEWKPYLERALPWLRTHEPEALARIYPNSKLKMTAESAREWVRVLKSWRAATAAN